MTDRRGLSAVEGKRGQAAFDPSTVPLYPLVRWQIRETSDGDLEGVVDDEVVATDVELEPVRRAIVEAGAREAAKRIGNVRAVRMRGTGLDGSVFNVVVTAGGEVYDSTPTGEADRQDRTSQQSRRKAPPRYESKSGRRAARLYTAGLVVLPLVLFGAPLALLAAQYFDDDTAKRRPPAPPPAQLPVVAPGGYADVARWSVPLGESAFAAAEGQVAADGHRVYVAQNGGNDIGAYDAASGRRRWAYTDLSGTVVAGPALARVGGVARVVAATSSELVLLDPATGREAGKWDLPGQTVGVQITATGPVVLVDDTHARIVVDGDLVTRVIPATGTPVAPSRNGSLVVTGGGEVWTVRSATLAGRSSRLPRFAGYRPEAAAGWTGSRLVVSYAPRSSTSSDDVRLLSVAAGSWRQQWVTEPVDPIYTATEHELGLETAPAGDWGIYGTTTVDLASGDVQGLPDDWETSVVGDVHAFGTGTGRPLAATRAGVTPAASRAPRPDPASMPQLVAPQAAAGGRAYLIANDGSHEALYALASEK